MVKIHWNRVGSSGIQSPASFPLKKNEKKNVALGIEKQLVKNQIKHYTACIGNLCGTTCCCHCMVLKVTVIFDVELLTHCFIDRCIPYRFRDYCEDGDADSAKVVEVLMINSPSGPGLLFPKV